VGNAGNSGRWKAITQKEEGRVDADASTHELKLY
jgi:hypothetical protein